MSRNIETVNAYLDSFRKNDHEQILSCLTDGIKWTVFGAFQLTGKDAYDKAIDGAPQFIDPPELKVVRMVEQGDVVMAELTGTAKRAAGGEMRSIFNAHSRHARQVRRLAQPCVGWRTTSFSRG